MFDNIRFQFSQKC